MSVHPATQSSLWLKQPTPTGLRWAAWPFRARSAPIAKKKYTLMSMARFRSSRLRLRSARARAAEARLKGNGAKRKAQQARGESALKQAKAKKGSSAEESGQWKKMSKWKSCLVAEARHSKAVRGRATCRPVHARS